MNLRFVPTSVHGAIDHVVGPTLVAAPELFRLKDDRAASLSPRVTGLVEAVYTNLTDYELSLKKLIPMKVHLALDAVGGAALAAVPWVAGSHRKGVRYWLPHTVVGLAEIGLALTTKSEAPKTKAARLRNVLRLT